MALVFFEGFDGPINNSNISSDSPSEYLYKKWNNSPLGNIFTAQSGAGTHFYMPTLASDSIHGPYGKMIGRTYSGSGWMRWYLNKLPNFPSVGTDDIIIGFYITPHNTSAGGRSYYFRLESVNGDNLIEFWPAGNNNGDYRIESRINGSTFFITPEPLPIGNSTSFHPNNSNVGQIALLELRLKRDPIAGVIELRFNEEVAYNFTGNTTEIINHKIARILFGWGSNYQGCFIDDLYVVDNTDNTGYMGFCKTHVIYPDADVSTDMIPSSGLDNFALINSDEFNSNILTNLRADNLGDEDIYLPTLPIYVNELKGLRFHLSAFSDTSVDRDDALVEAFLPASGANLSTDIADTKNASNWTVFGGVYIDSDINPFPGTNSIRFDGTGYIVEPGGNDLLFDGLFTIEWTWRGAQNAGFISKDIDLYWAASNLKLPGYNAFAISGLSSSDDGLFHHFAMARDSSNILRLFKDGQIISEREILGTIDFSGINFGRRADTDLNYSTGWLYGLKATKGACRYASVFIAPLSAYTTAAAASYSYSSTYRIGNSDPMFTSSVVTLGQNENFYHNHFSRILTTNDSGASSPWADTDILNMQIGQKRIS